MANDKYMQKQPKVKMQHIINCINCIMNIYVKDKLNVIILGDINVDMMKPNNLGDCLDINRLKHNYYY